MYRSADALFPNGQDFSAFYNRSCEGSQERQRSGKKLKTNASNNNFVKADLRFLTSENVDSENSFLSPKRKMVNWNGRNL